MMCMPSGVKRMTPKTLDKKEGRFLPPEVVGILRRLDGCVLDRSEEMGEGGGGSLLPNALATSLIFTAVLHCTEYKMPKL